MRVALLHASVVGFGGLLGTLARYGLAGLVHRIGGTSEFPYGTLMVNLLGCLLIGVLAGLMEGREAFSPEFRVFALVGILGGFTTFSTFGYESFMLLRDAAFMRVAMNVGLHVVGGVALVWLGYALTSIGGQVR